MSKRIAGKTPENKQETAETSQLSSNENTSVQEPEEVTRADSSASDTETEEEELTWQQSLVEEVRNFRAQDAVNRYLESNGIKMNHDTRRALARYVKRLQKKVWKIVNALEQAVKYITKRREEFVHDPKKDFVRKGGKIKFRDVLLLLILMGGGNTDSALDDFYGTGNRRPDKSAFRKQRNKVAEEAMSELLYTFNAKMPITTTPDGWAIIAIDGTCIRLWSDGGSVKTWVTCGENETKGYSAGYMVGAYNVIDQTYEDAVITGVKEKNEPAAGVDLMKTCMGRRQGAPSQEKNKPVNKFLFLYDRGFACANLYATAQKLGAGLLVRVKASEAARLLGITPAELTHREFSIRMSLDVKRSRSVESEEGNITRYVDGSTRFDYLPPRSKDLYTIHNLRVISVLLNTGECEYLVTNLSEEEFTLKDIAQLYSLRWGIELSIRFLKCVLGATTVHAKDFENAKKEIWGGLLLHNVCSQIMALAAQRLCVQQLKDDKNGKCLQRINHTEAIHLSTRFVTSALGYRKYLWNNRDDGDLLDVISKRKVYVRRGRKAERHPQAERRFSFVYRYCRY